MREKNHKIRCKSKEDMGDQIKSHLRKSRGKDKKNMGSQIDKKSQSHHIPNDLIFNILPKLPVKSLVRFKCVSKSWCSFISQLKLGNHKLLFSTENCIQSVDFEVPNIVTQPLYFPLLLGPFEIIGSCNGLLCVIMKNEDVVVLCNPLTRTYRSIALSKIDPINDHCDQFGFGYDQSTDDYKILRILGSSMFQYGSLYTLRFHIYSLNADSWKFKKFTLPLAPYMYLSQSATFVKGALYWGIHCGNKILCYDLMDEKIRVIQLPDNVGMTNKSFVLRDFGGSLCLIAHRYQSPDYVIDILALEDDKWIKLMSIPPPEEVLFYHKYLKPVCLMKDGQVLMKLDNPFNVFLSILCRRKFFLFSPEVKKVRELEIEDIDIRYAARFHSGITYTETLVSPFRLKKTLSDSGALAQRVLEGVRTKKHVCNIRTKCDHHPRVNWKQWQRRDRTKKTGYKKVAIT